MKSDDRLKGLTLEEFEERGRSIIGGFRKRGKGRVKGKRRVRGRRGKEEEGEEILG